jgi:hypothetical protein
MKNTQEYFAAKNARRKLARVRGGRTIVRQNREMGRLLAMNMYDHGTGRIAAAPKGSKKPLIDA